MITPTSDRQVSAHGAGSPISFGIAKDPRPIFQALRTGLYSNKPLAVIREYSTNAYDAHVDAGCPMRPIQVTLPTALDPVLRIRDFGKGLSLAQIENVYTKFGESDKRDSNEMIGHLGFGSKSGFAYGNAFTVTSFQGGLKAVYEAYLDESDIGAILPMGTDPTDQEDGLEIAIHCKQGDIYTITQTAQEFYRYFKPRPVILGNEAVTKQLDHWDTFLPAYEGHDWALNTSGRGKIIMGNIAYPLDAAVFADETETGYPKLIKGCELVLYPKIGDVQNAISRESLQYTESTKTWIKGKLDEVLAQLRAQFIKQANEAPDLWTARQALVRMNDLPYQIKEVMPDTLYRNGVSVTESILPEEYQDLRKIGVAVKCIEAKRSYSEVRAYEADLISATGQPAFVIYTRNFPAMDVAARAQAAHTKLGRGKTFLIKLPAGVSAEVVANHPSFAGVIFQDLKQFSPAHLPSDGRQRRGTSSAADKRKFDIFRFNGSNPNGIAPSENWSAAEEQTVEGGEGVYVVIDQFKLVEAESWLKYGCTLSDLSDKLNSLRRSVAKVPRAVYGVRESAVPNLGPGWVHLKDYVTDKIEAYFEEKKLHKAYTLGLALSDVDDFYRQIVPITDKLPGGKLRRLLNIIGTHDNGVKKQQIKAVDAVLTYVTIFPKIGREVTLSLGNEQWEVESAYPMLSTLRSAGYGGLRYVSDPDQQAEFIRFVRACEVAQSL